MVDVVRDADYFKQSSFLLDPFQHWCCSSVYLECACIDDDVVHLLFKSRVHVADCYHHGLLKAKI